ncbi:MAG: exopolysaccharide biosynthesis polyprenyl glycosylphosphotransferase [Deltaproteobacteria bacterium]|nr:exopolysaccharide biosynthesis polyprenyl glycosylphosphotransferase [Deltaproteobacteria bacterium]
MRSIFSSPIFRRKLVLLFGDDLCIIFGELLVFSLYWVLRGNFDYSMLPRQSVIILPTIFFYFITFYIFGLYTLEHLPSRVYSLLPRIILAVVINAIPPIIYSFIFSKYLPGMGRIVIITKIPVIILLITLWRLFFNTVVMKNIKLPRVGIILSPKYANEYLRDLLPYNGIEIDLAAICIFSTNDETFCPVLEDVPRHVNLVATIEELSTIPNIDMIAIPEDTQQLNSADIDLLMQLRVSGMRLMDLPSFYRKLTLKTPIFFVDNQWKLNFMGLLLPERDIFLKAKAIVDRMGSLVLLVLLSPVMLLIALAIKLESPGPVFFIQERLGFLEIPFKIYKFRTMVVDAERKFGSLWVQKDDPRVTRVGKHLRRLRLDELPQLINVLIGEMSFIGPRPMKPDFARRVKQRINFHPIRHVVKPGITGWAQINMPYVGSITEELEKFQYDLFYIQSQSALLDLYIIINTIHYVLIPRGQ